MIELNLIGFSTSGRGDTFTTGMNPATGETLSGQFPGATIDEVNQAVTSAQDAAVVYGKMSGEEKAEFLNAIAEEIENLGDKLVERCCAESGLPEARIIGERGRTTGQLRMFADLVSEGSWLEATIDTAQNDRTPVPKPDLRRMLVPMGPVVVFAASNFPLAFSTAGGDTASALAGGNPVIVKAHGAHPGTSAMIGEAIVKAAKRTGMPHGVFSLLHGSGKIVGQGLIQHPGIKAAGFTGSEQAGRTLLDLANQRPEPIPFFAEMGSVNPVLLLPSAFNSETADLLAGSITMGVGQFCTNPGLIISTAGPDLDHFIQMLGAALSQLESGVMLTERICKSYQDGVESTLSQQGITVESRSENGNGPNMGQPTLASVAGETFLADPELATEVFGPFSMVVKCKDNAELEAAIESLSGQLTGSVIGSKDELDQYHPAIETMESKVGRIIYNGVPTGVEVCPSMQHGGPYPASSDARFTSVGTAAIKRFVRPIAFQSWPQEKLPRELQDGNPMNIWRLVNGNLSKDS